MLRLTLALSLLATSWADAIGRPIYKYTYQAEDMSSDATIPIGYHVIEGGYYPGIGIGGGGIGIGGGGGGIGIGGGGGGIGIGGGGGQFIGRPYAAGIGIGGGGGGYYPGLIGGGGGIGLGGAGIGIGGGGGGGFIGGGGGGGIIGGGGIGGIGGEYIDKNVYSGGKKNLNDLHYEKVNGKKGEEFEQGQGGFNQGKAAIKNAKGDSGYYADEHGGKKLADEEKVYKGGHLYNQEGKNEVEKKIKQGHKKGHVIKGFKTSHHKDETGKTEEFYDEENDEGANFNLHGQAGQFGENALSAYKGEHENGEFKADQGKKQGHYDNEHFYDNANADHGQYGSKKYGGNGAVYGANNGVDQQSLLGHQENSKYFKHYPHHVPFFVR